MHAATERKGMKNALQKIEEKGKKRIVCLSYAPTRSVIRERNCRIMKEKKTKKERKGLCNH